jgi:hypothetical protein
MTRGQTQARPWGGVFELCRRTGSSTPWGQIRKYVCIFCVAPKLEPGSRKGTYVAADFLPSRSIQLIGFHVRYSAFCPSAVQPRLPSSPLRPARLHVVLPSPIACAQCACASCARGNNQNQRPAAGRWRPRPTPRSWSAHVESNGGKKLPLSPFIVFVYVVCQVYILQIWDLGIPYATTHMFSMTLNFLKF